MSDPELKDHLAMIAREVDMSRFRYGPGTNSAPGSKEILQSLDRLALLALAALRLWVDK